MTLQEFINKYLGKQVEFHSSSKGVALNQCVDLVNTYIKEVLELTPIINTDAKDFPRNANASEFTFIKNTLLGLPNTGDIIVWNEKIGDSAGHVAIFIEGNLINFKSFDQNWSVKQYSTLEEHSYYAVSGWLAPIKIADMKPDKRLPDNFYKIAEFKDANKLWGLEEGDAYDKTLDKANKAVKSLQEKLKDCDKLSDSKREQIAKQVYEYIKKHIK